MIKQTPSFVWGDHPPQSEGGVLEKADGKKQQEITVFYNFIGTAE